MVGAGKVASWRMGLIIDWLSAGVVGLWVQLLEVSVIWGEGCMVKGWTYVVVCCIG